MGNEGNYDGVLSKESNYGDLRSWRHDDSETNDPRKCQRVSDGDGQSSRGGDYGVCDRTVSVVVD